MLLMTSRSKADVNSQMSAKLKINTLSVLSYMVDWDILDLLPYKTIKEV